MPTSQHSRLAMKEARRIARSSQKLKIGRSICHHLLLMIEDSEATSAPGTASVKADILRANKPDRNQYSLSL